MIMRGMKNYPASKNMDDDDGLTLTTVMQRCLTLEDTFDLPNVDSTNSLWCEALGNPGRDHRVVEAMENIPKQSKTSPSFVLKLSSRKQILQTYVWLTNDLLVSRLNLMGKVP